MKQLQETNSELSRLIQRSFLGDIATKSYTYVECQNEYQALLRREENTWLGEMNKVNGKLAERQGRQADFLAEWEVGFGSNSGRDHTLSVEAADLQLVLGDSEEPRPRIEVSYDIFVQHHVSRKDQGEFKGELYTSTRCTWVWPLQFVVSEVDPVQEADSIYSGFTGIVNSPFPGESSQSAVGRSTERDSLLANKPSHFGIGYGSFNIVDRSGSSNAGMDG
jgi:hypothetical protein